MPRRLTLEDVQKMEPGAAYVQRARFKKRSPVVEALELKCCEAPKWACWLRCYVEGLPEEIKRKAELKACEDQQYAYWLRIGVDDLPEDVKRKAELKACEDPRWACMLRCRTEDLPEDVKRKAELKACEDPKRAYELLYNVGDLPEEVERKAELKAIEKSHYRVLLAAWKVKLHPDTQKVLDLIRLGFEPKVAISMVERGETCPKG